MLENLTRLHFSNAQVSGTRQDLVNLDNLTRLNFSDTHVCGTTEDLVKLENLTRLILANTQVSGTTKNLAKLNNLKKLHFTKTQVVGTTEDFAKLKKLIDLRFFNTPGQVGEFDTSRFLQHAGDGEQGEPGHVAVEDVALRRNTCPTSRLGQYVKLAEPKHRRGADLRCGA